MGMEIAGHGGSAGVQRCGHLAGPIHRWASRTPRVPQQLLPQPLGKEEAESMDRGRGARGWLQTHSPPASASFLLGVCLSFLSLVIPRQSE